LIKHPDQWACIVA